MGFTRAELESYRNASIPELMPAHPRLVFVGINPGLWTAATGTPFAHPGNRFYPALVAAGILPRLPDFTRTLSADDRHMIEHAGIGILNLVNRATARADELTRDELREGGRMLEVRLTELQPAVVAVVGITAYRQAFARPKAQVGEQVERLGGCRTWVLPNPSGLNAHDTVSTLAEAYAAPSRAAGIL